MNTKEVVVALYDDSERNKNIMPRSLAEDYAEEIVGDRLISLAPHRAVKRRIYPCIFFDVLEVKEARIESDAPGRGQVIAVCDIVKSGERRC